LEAFTSEAQLNILLTEVIEHNTLDEAEELIKKALSYNFNRLIITTPNVEFNSFYSMEDEFRHKDHCFELTRNEFQSLISSCTEGRNVNVEYFYLGDNLNGIQPTQGCIIKNEYGKRGFETIAKPHQLVLQEQNKRFLSHHLSCA
jgi:hypothetical protein